MLGSPHADSTNATAGRESSFFDGCERTTAGRRRGLAGWLALIACALLINLQPSASICSHSAEMAAQPAAWRSPASHKGSHGSTAAGIAASTATALPQGPLRGEQTASRDRGSGPGQCVSFVGRTRLGQARHLHANVPSTVLRTCWRRSNATPGAVSLDEQHGLVWRLAAVEPGLCVLREACRAKTVDGHIHNENGV